MIAYEHGLKITEKSEFQAETPPFKGGVRAGTALVSVATVVDYGDERVKTHSRSAASQLGPSYLPLLPMKLVINIQESNALRSDTIS